MVTSALGKTSSTTYSYVYNGDSLVKMTVGGNALYFAYDASGKPLTLTCDGTTYYYVLNLQGDVAAILDGGSTVVGYAYDAWGYIRATSGDLANTLGKANALRYRGYVYDTETCLYYLQSRYYNPGTGRFINADALVVTGQGLLGNNMFAYCNNNPVCLEDVTGTASCVALNDDCDIFAKPTGDVTTGGDYATVITVAKYGLAITVTSIVVFSARAAIRAFAKALTDYSVSQYDNHQPRIHHVIPRGDFSKYSEKAQDQLVYMHQLLEKAGISVDDPENLLIMSHGSHKSLHTEPYINVIYDIMSRAKPESEESVRMYLYLARTYASGMDQYPLNY